MVGLHDLERIAIEIAENKRHSPHTLRQALAEAFEGRSLAVGMEGADDGHTGPCGGEGVVVGDFAGQIKLGALGDGVLEMFSACAGEDGGFVDGLVGRAGDEEIGKGKLLFDALEERWD